MRFISKNQTLALSLASVSTTALAISLANASPQILLGSAITLHVLSLVGTITALYFGYLAILSKNREHLANSPIVYLRPPAYAPSAPPMSQILQDYLPPAPPMSQILQAYPVGATEVSSNPQDQNTVTGILSQALRSTRSASTSIKINRTQLACAGSAALAAYSFYKKHLPLKIPSFIPPIGSSSDNHHKEITTRCIMPGAAIALAFCASYMYKQIKSRNRNIPVIPPMAPPIVQAIPVNY